MNVVGYFFRFPRTKRKPPILSLSLTAEQVGLACFFFSQKSSEIVDLFYTIEFGVSCLKKCVIKNVQLVYIFHFCDHFNEVASHDSQIEVF